MGTRTFRVSLSLVLLMLCMRIEGGNGAIVSFPDKDERVSEDISQAKIPVQVDGKDGGNFTLIVTPLTVAQYQAQSNQYGSICDSVLDANLDTAEEVDFSVHPIEVEVLDDDVQNNINSIFYEFLVDIAINDDVTQEPEEYFLVVLEIGEFNLQNKLEIDRSKQCARIRIKVDNRDTFGVVFEPTVTEVWEDAGQVEMFKIVKQGETEQVVNVMLSCLEIDCSDDFTVPAMITLQPNETSAMVNIIILDDIYPEDNQTFTIAGQYGNPPLSITILDNDHAVIGFVATEVTVIEGEPVVLTTVLKNNNLTTSDYHRFEYFTIKILGGNATEMEHYKLKHHTILTESSYVPGDPIEIETVDDTKLERSRHFEVVIEDPSLDPLNILNPRRVVVTIRDNDGTPNQPSLGAATFTEEAITLSWTIERHELRPIHEYDITIESIQVRSPPPSIRDRRSFPVRINRQAANGQGDRRIEKHQYTVTKANCKTDVSSGRAIDHCEHTVDQTVERGTAYNVIMCAGNEFASVCDESRFAIPVIVTATTRGPAGLEGENNSGNGGGLPTTTVLWIVIGVLAALLICCSVLACLSFCSAVYALHRRESKEIDEEDTKRSSGVRIQVRAASSDSTSSIEAV